jgi:hypothetical protein
MLKAHSGLCAIAVCSHLALAILKLRHVPLPAVPHDVHA